MKLLSIFSNSALFQAESSLTLHGYGTEGSTVSAKIIGNDTTISSFGETGSDGMFEVTLSTPGASYQKYTIEISDGTDCITLTDIMFGELWLASGQSNMELFNNSINESKWYLDKLKEYDIRVFSQEYGPREGFSTKPQLDTKGVWVSTLNPDMMLGVSACATGFIKGLYERFLQIGKKDVPVGFLNVSWGATTIEAWISQDRLLSDSRAVYFMDKYNRNYTEETINDNSIMVIQKPSVMYNRKIAPILGVKVRGIIWYQGESNVWCEFEERIYADFLNLYYETYRDLFAANKDDFKVICSLIYPWMYRDEGDTLVGYLNEAFVSVAKKYPDRFVCCPCYDLPPSWHSLDNHPIHPMNKYPLGERLSILACRNVYGDNGHKSPCFVKDIIRDGCGFVVRFDSCGSKLYTNDNKHIRGMYIAGDDGLYMPADCKIISDSEVFVYHPYLENPCHCMYGRASAEVNLNLFCGDFPVMPFATDNDSETPIKVELKSFVNLEVMSELDYFDASALHPDWYYRPVWKPLDGCDVCKDNAFAIVSKGFSNSIGVGGTKNPFGMYAASHQYHAFDFQNYNSIEVDVYSVGELTFDVILSYDDGRGVSIATEFTGDVNDEFKHYTASFKDIPDGNISKMTFSFRLENDRTMKHLNVGSVYLKPKSK